MSWTDVFPVLTDEMVKEWRRSATRLEKRESADWFAVERTINPSPARHLVVFSLFWKNAKAEDPDLPVLSRKILRNAMKMGLVERFPPWDHYVQPLLDGVRRLKISRPDVGVRIYLAGDLSFLTEDFTALGCEICVMKSSSLRHNPGAMWRFLALGERGRLVTFSDADRAREMEADVQRTEAVSKAGLGYWRVPVWGETNNKGMVPYRPFLAGQFGTCQHLPTEKMMQALIWHSRRGSISGMCRPPGCGERTIHGTQWPDYGFDEWFLLAAVYPRAAKKGILSFIPAAARSNILPLDIEYTTWAHPGAEMMHFGGGGSCCAPFDIGVRGATEPSTDLRW